MKTFKNSMYNVYTIFLNSDTYISMKTLTLNVIIYHAALLS